MRKIIVFTILIAAIFLAWSVKNKPENKPQSSSPTTSPARFKNTVSIPYQDEIINISWFEADAKAITLIPNFSAKKTASEIADEFKCTSLINGGFYSKEGYPIGLFVAEDKTVGSLQQNQLFNGFVKISQNGNFSISTDSSTQNTKIALQTGPLLYRNGIPLKLAIRNDEPARRMAVAVSGSNVYFIAVYQKDSVYFGPRLSDLPDLISTLEDKSGIKIKDAVNLDGGSASAFYTDGLSLPEITPVGSFFCVTD